MAKNKKFMHGIGQVRFERKMIGCIEKSSQDWDDMKPEKTDVEAEQMPTIPMLTLMQKNGTTSPTLNFIQLDYENLHPTMGGTLVSTSGAYADWKAPANLVELRDKCEIDLVNGQTVHMSNATLMSDFGGKLTLTEMSKLECQLTANMPGDDDAPYEVLDTQKDPGE